MNARLVVLLLLLPQVTTAKVYMCRDPATGKTTFTDVACNAQAVREEVRVPPTNLDSGRRTAAPPPRGAWISDLDTRKTGREYNAIGGTGDVGVTAVTGVAAGLETAEEES